VATGVLLQYVATYGTDKGRGFAQFFMYFSAVGGNEFNPLALEMDI